MQQQIFNFFSSLLVSFIIYRTEANITKDDMLRFAVKCNATLADMKVFENYELPNTETGKCFMRCMLNDLHTFDETGEFTEETGLAAMKIHWSEFPESILKKIAFECAQYMKFYVILKNTCEYAYKTMNCIDYDFKKNKLLVVPSMLKNKTSNTDSNNTIILLKR